MPGRDRGMDELVKLVSDLPGWKVRPTKKNHTRVTSPTGQSASIPGTPSDHKSYPNVVAQLRRIGAPIPPRGHPGAPRKPKGAPQRRANPQ